MPCRAPSISSRQSIREARWARHAAPAPGPPQMRRRHPGDNRAAGTAEVIAHLEDRKPLRFPLSSLRRRFLAVGPRQEASPCRGSFDAQNECS